ncbi:MAG: hypothetical protein V1813_02195 [Candidatus Aenigmatarchaeota archaeon]
MAVIGLNLNSIQAKKQSAVPRQDIKVNSTPMITGVKEIDLPNLSKKALSIDFEFLTRYEPSFASIAIEGSLLYLADNNKELVSEFAKNKKLPEKASMEVLNYLFRHCLLKASILAEDLQLPPPMPMPKITPKK